MLEQIERGLRGRDQYFQTNLSVLRSSKKEKLELTNLG